MKDRVDRALPWLVFLLAVAMAVQYLVLVHREQAVAACQARYNDAFTQNLVVRSRIGQDSDQNKNDIILGVGRLIAAPRPKTAAQAAALGKQYRQLFVTFAAKTAEVESARAANPLPPFPHC